MVGISFQVQVNVGDALNCMKPLCCVTKKYTVLKKPHFMEFSKLGFLELYADCIITSGMCFFPWARAARQSSLTISLSVGLSIMLISELFEKPASMS